MNPTTEKIRKAERKRVLNWFAEGLKNIMEVTGEVSRNGCNDHEKGKLEGVIDCARMMLEAVDERYVADVALKCHRCGGPIRREGHGPFKYCSDECRDILSKKAKTKIFGRGV